MAGFIYIMSNPSFVSGRIKIGKSDRDPEEFRKSELDGTGVPEPFKVEYYVFVDDHHKLERMLHKKFDHTRANKSREFFDVPIREVIEEIKKVAEIKLEVNNYVKETMEEIPRMKTLAGPYLRYCTKCLTQFPITVVNGEWYTDCPVCLPTGPTVIARLYKPYGPNMRWK
jgi:Meiotically up-regulated gene 113